MGAASAVRGSGKRPRCAWGGDLVTTGVVVKSLLPDGHGSACRSSDAWVGGCDSGHQHSSSEPRFRFLRGKYSQCSIRVRGTLYSLKMQFVRSFFKVVSTPPNASIFIECASYVRVRIFIIVRGVAKYFLIEEELSVKFRY